MKLTKKNLYHIAQECKQWQVIAYCTIYKNLDMSIAFIINTNQNNFLTDDDGTELNRIAKIFINPYEKSYHTTKNYYKMILQQIKEKNKWQG